MTVDDIASVVGVAFNELPNEVQIALAGVRIVAVSGFDAPELVEHPELTRANDWKGFFTGRPLKGNEDEPGSGTPPRGTIFLNAATIADGDEAIRIFAHEVGHALGLSETDVEALGLVTEGDPTHA